MSDKLRQYASHQILFNENLTMQRIPEEMRDADVIRLIVWDCEYIEGQDTPVRTVHNIIEVKEVKKFIIYFNKHRKTWDVDSQFRPAGQNLKSKPTFDGKLEALKYENKLSPILNQLKAEADENAAYQLIINGKPVVINELTRDQLLTGLRNALDKIEEFDGYLAVINRSMEKYREGK